MSRIGMDRDLMPMLPTPLEEVVRRALGQCESVDGHGHGS